MAGTIICDRIESDASFPSSINIASPIIVSNTFAIPAGSVGAPALSPVGDTNTGIYFPAADAIGISTNGVDRIRVTSAGNVGIGTNSPATNLHVGSGSGENLGVLLSRGVTTNFYQAHDGTKIFIAGVDNTQDFIKIGSLNSHPVGFVTGNGERMRITSAGDVGIGTSSPATRLQVSGVVRADSYNSVAQVNWTQTIGNSATDGLLTLPRDQKVYQVVVRTQSGAFDVNPRAAMYLVNSNPGTTSGLSISTLGGDTGAFTVTVENVSTSQIRVRCAVIDADRVFAAMGASAIGF